MQLEIPEGIQPINVNSSSPSSAGNATALSNSSNVPTKLEIPEGIKPLESEPKSESVGDKLKSYANAVSMGIHHGAETFLTTLDKVIANKIMNNPGAAEVAQAKYDEDTKRYNEAVDTNKHPLAAGLGNFTAGAIMTSPFLATGGSAVGGLMGGAAADLGAGAMGQSIAKGAGAVLGNAVQGGAMGGVMTTPGQNPNQVWNPEQAKFGAITGAVLTPVQALVGRAFGSAADYEKQAVQLAKQGYAGPIFSTDVPNQGMWNGVKQSLVNNVLSKLPFINKIPGVGVVSARNAQNEGVRDAIESYLNNIANKYPNGSVTQFQNALESANNAAQDTIHQASQEFRDALDSAGITSHNLIKSQPIIDQLLADQSELSRPFKQILQKTKDNITSISNNDLLGSFDQVGFRNGFKQAVYHESERLANFQNNTDAHDQALVLKDLYNNIKQDIEGSIGNNTEALQAFHKFNTTTTAIEDLWGSEHSPMIAKALQSMNADSQGFMTFWKAMNSDSLAPNVAQKYTQMLGQEGKTAIANNQLQQAFESSMDSTGRFNITKFVSSFDPNSQANSPVKDALGGVLDLAKTVAKAQSVKPGGLISDTTRAGLAGGAAYMVPGGRELLGGLTATGAALGSIIAHPPLKNSLMMLNKITGQNPGMSQYLLNKSANQLMKAGIIMTHQPDGSISLDKQ